MFKRAKSATRRINPALVILLLAMLLANLGINPAFARDTENPDDDPPPPPPGGTPAPPYNRPANGFDWAAQSRYLSANDPGNIAGWYWNEDQQIYNSGYIRPGQFRQNFTGCVNQTDYDKNKANSPTTYIYQWTFNGQVIEVRQCLISYNFPQQGTYAASLTVKTSTGAYHSGPFNQSISVRDYLVVALGDSYGSGEGAPDVAKNGSTPASWLSERCHRSHSAPSAVAARKLEAADPKTSVTYISFACSGANIATESRDPDDTWHSMHPYYYRPVSKSVGVGILAPYRGIEPKSNYNPAIFLPNQIDQIKAAVGNRPIDALIMSAGGNDMGFSKIAIECLIQSTCYTSDVPSRDNYDAKVSLDTRVRQDAAVMPMLYAQMGQRIRSELNPRSVFITEYPDSTLNESGQPCIRMLEDVTGYVVWEPTVTQVEVSWLHNSVVPIMNTEVSRGAVHQGWTYVGGVSDAFYGHGYCTSNRFINRAEDSSARQGGSDTETTGTLHPNYSGYGAIGTQIYNYLKPAMDRLSTATPNLALGAKVSASSSVEGWGWFNWALTDGNRNTGGVSSGFSSNGSLGNDHPEWVMLDMTSVKTVSQVVLYPRNDPTRIGQGFPANFNIKVASDAYCEQWWVVASQTNYPNPGANAVTLNIAPRQAKCIRVEGTSLRPNPYEDNTYRMQFAEIEAY